MKRADLSGLKRACLDFEALRADQRLRPGIVCLGTKYFFRVETGDVHVCDEDSCRCRIKPSMESHHETCEFTGFSHDGDDAYKHEEFDKETKQPLYQQELVVKQSLRKLAADRVKRKYDQLKHTESSHELLLLEQEKEKESERERRKMIKDNRDAKRKPVDPFKPLPLKVAENERLRLKATEVFKQNCYRTIQANLLPGTVVSEKTKELCVMYTSSIIELMRRQDNTRSIPSESLVCTILLRDLFADGVEILPVVRITQNQDIKANLASPVPEFTQKKLTKAKKSIRSCFLAWKKLYIKCETHLQLPAMIKSNITDAEFKLIKTNPTSVDDLLKPANQKELYSEIKDLL